MSLKRILFVVMVGILLLAGGIQLGGPDAVLARPLSPPAAGGDGTVPYAGTLTTSDGQPVAGGLYDFSFALYAAESAGDPSWSEVQLGVPVQGGIFELALGRTRAIPPEALDTGARWLEVAVRGPAETAFTPLLPRQLLTIPSPGDLAQTTAAAACPHDHVGEAWTASVPWSGGAFKVYNYSNGPSIWGWNGGNGNGLRGYATGAGLGVYGESQNNAGVVGRSTTGRGLEGYSTSGNGVLAHSDVNHSLYVDGAGKNGVHVASSGEHGVYVATAGWSGVSVASASVAGVWVNSAGQDGVLVNTAGWDGVHVTGPVGGSCYGCGARGAEDFAVLNTGEVRSRVGFAAPANVFAVTVAIEGTRAGYEPGDVLAVSASGTAAAERTSVAYSPSVIGIYSESPAFVGGRTVTGENSAGSVTVAVLGVVDCKVSAENGPIRPGDLLVTATTPGHAMRADRELALAGTILGKALESLDSGTGVIQVLVTLQ